MLSDWGYFAAFTPAGAIILAAAFVAAFAFLAAFIFVSYRKRQTPGYIDDVAASTIPPDDPPIPGTLLDPDEGDGLPPTHSRPSQPWRHA